MKVRAETGSPREEGGTRSQFAQDTLSYCILHLPTSLMPQTGRGSVCQQSSPVGRRRTFRKELDPGGQWGTTPSPAELLARQSAICKVLPRTRQHQGHRCFGALMDFPSLPEEEVQVAWEQLAQCLSSLLQILPPTAHTHTAFKLTFPVPQPTPPPC